MNNMDRDEHILLSEVLGAVDAYDMHKAKSGNTINIQFISKDEICTSCDRKSFRSYEDAIKYMQKCIREVASE